jgi:hypothetical protein
MAAPIRELYERIVTNYATRQLYNRELKLTKDTMEPHALECVEFARAVVEGSPSPVPPEQSLIVGNVAAPRTAYDGKSMKTTEIGLSAAKKLIPGQHCVILGIGSDGSRPFDDAARTLRELAKKYDILYLSARPASVAHRTRRWLNANDFPAGPVLGSRNLIDFFAQTNFKKKTLARLQRERGNMLIGIGDRPRDAEAYRANQMLPIVVNPCSGGKFHPNELVFETWDDVARFFQANENTLQDPLKLAQSIKKGQLHVTVPG